MIMFKLSEKHIHKFPCSQVFMHMWRLQKEFTFTYKLIFYHFVPEWGLGGWGGPFPSWHWVTAGYTHHKHTMLPKKNFNFGHWDIQPFCSGLDSLKTTERKLKTHPKENSIKKFFSKKTKTMTSTWQLSIYFLPLCPWMGSQRVMEPFPADTGRRQGAPNTKKIHLHLQP